MKLFFFLYSFFLSYVSLDILLDLLLAMEAYMYM